jgi:hypothetical protein
MEREVTKNPSYAGYAYCYTVAFNIIYMNSLLSPNAFHAFLVHKYFKMLCVITIQSTA